MVQLVLGKSTLINLIPRFFDVTNGEILVDDINVKEYKQEILHNKIGYVSQKAVMFSDTVKNNVNYGENGRKTSEEEIIKAIEVAQGKDFIEKMEDSYNSHIAARRNQYKWWSKAKNKHSKSNCEKSRNIYF